MPARDKVRLGTLPRHGAEAHPHGTLAHKLGHMGGFGLAAGLLILLARDEYPAWKAGLPAFFLGAVLETIEPTVLQSVFEWWDVRDDGIGVAVAVVAFEILHRRHAREHASAEMSRLGSDNRES